MDNLNSPSNTDLDAILDVLRKIPVFSALDSNMHREIAKQIVLMYYPADYQIFKEQDPGDALYVIRKGKIKITRAPKEGSVLPEDVAELGSGEFFGEMSLISDIPHTARAKTTEESEIFVLSKENFNELLKTNPVMAEQVSATIVKRMNLNDKQV
ncbi:MAG: cyclic nucleotide-binding domain-containing protein [Candidatus Gracilibacteria bacterium]|jgi:CRP-like cAMP-binding protein